MNKVVIIILGIFTSMQISFAQVEHSSGGSASVYTLAYPSNLPTLTSGLSFTFKANHSSIGASSININSIGAVPIKKEVSQDLVANDILSGQIVTLVYDGANFQMISKAGTSEVGSRIQDLDNNTFVETGTGDVINFNLGGTNHFRMVGPRLEVYNTSGIFIGEGAGQSAGASTIAIGYRSMWNGTGADNVGIGFNALRSTTTAVNNVALGSSAGYDLSIGSNNTMIGYQSLNNTTGGYYNTAIGFNAGQAFDNSHNNTFIGRNADANAAGLTNSAAIGANAMVGQNNSLVLGSINGVNGSTANTKVGIGTITPATTLDITGTDAVILTQGTTAQRPTGENGMVRYNTTLSQFEGYENGAWVALVSSGGVDSRIQDNDNNTFIETDAIGDGSGNLIDFNLDGVVNFQMNGPRLGVFNSGRSVLIGQGAGQNLDVSAIRNNIFLGFNAGLNTTNGGNNIAIGGEALQSNATYSENTAVGSQALRFNEANRNTAVGASAMSNNTSGVQNAALGYSALQANTVGTSNTAIGYNALFNTIGHNNSGLGLSAGQTNTTGGNNTLLGHYADVGAGGLNNATAIGSSAYVTQSNSLVLGAISGVNGAGSNTNVGIGTTAPTERLEVAGNLSIVDDSYRLVRPDEGPEDLLPLAYGVIESGVIVTSTSTLNFSVINLGTGQYRVTYTGPRTFDGYNKFQMEVSPHFDGSQPLVANYQYADDDAVDIFLWTLAGTPIDGVVSFTLRVK